MPKRKSITELEEAARAAEERAKKLREAIKKQTIAERAKINSEIIIAIQQWQNNLSIDMQTEWEDLPALFRQAGDQKLVLNKNYYEDFLDAQYELDILKGLVKRLCQAINITPTEFEKYVSQLENNHSESDNEYYSYGSAE